MERTQSQAGSAQPATRQLSAAAPRNANASVGSEAPSGQASAAVGADLHAADVDSPWRDRHLARLREAIEQADRALRGPTTNSEVSGHQVEADYPARVAAAVRPWIVYVGKPDRHLVAEVELRLDIATGRVMQRRVLTPSRASGWDLAVLAAIDKAGVLPMPARGPAPAVLVLVFTPAEP